MKFGEYASPVRIVACAGAVVFDRFGRLLVIRRRHDPGSGLWSIPGGKVEPGETSAQACVRETLEESGIAVVIDRLLGTVERPGPDCVFAIDDFLCRPTPDESSQTHHTGPPDHNPVAGDDASDARWVDRAALEALPLVDRLWEALAGWDVLPS